MATPSKTMESSEVGISTSGNFLKSRIDFNHACSKEVMGKSNFLNKP